MLSRKSRRSLLAFILCLWPAALGRGEDPAASPAPPQNALRIKNLRVGKILYLGNSITRHPLAPQLGWHGDWGMAASAPENDYVHRLTQKIADAAGGRPEIMARNIADFERQHATYHIAAELKKELAFEPDVVIIAIGENVPALTSDEAKATFRAALDKLLAEINSHGRPELFVRSSFWADQAKDAILQAACQQAGGTFVDIGRLGKDEANFARSERKFENDGVAGHPGDQGMLAIADALWAAIEARSQAAQPVK